MLTLSLMGPSGHTVVVFDGGKALVNFQKTSPGERGMIATLVEKAQKLGLKLHRAKKGEAGDPLEALTDVLMDAKGEIALVGTSEAVEDLAFEMVAEEIRGNRVVSEAQPDGTWKVLKMGDWKRGEKKGAEEKKELVEAAAPKDPSPKTEAETAKKAPEEKRAVNSHKPAGGG